MAFHTSIGSSPAGEIDARNMVYLQLKIMERFHALVEKNMPDLNSLLAQATQEASKDFFSGKLKNISVTREDDQITLRMRTEAQLKP